MEPSSNHMTNFTLYLETEYTFDYTSIYLQDQVNGNIKLN